MQNNYVMEVIVALFGMILSVLGTIIAIYFRRVEENTSNMKNEMVNMNIKLEKVITDQSWHKEELRECKNTIGTIFDRINAIELKHKQ